MKRVKSACLQQTIHFELNEKLDHAEAAAAALREAELYKKGLERKGIRFTVDSETVLEDGTPELRIRKQYNSYPLGTYLD